MHGGAGCPLGGAGHADSRNAVQVALARETDHRRSVVGAFCTGGFGAMPLGGCALGFSTPAVVGAPVVGRVGAGVAVDVDGRGGLATVVVGEVGFSTPAVVGAPVIGRVGVVVAGGAVDVEGRGGFAITTGSFGPGWVVAGGGVVSSCRWSRTVGVASSCR